MKRRILIYLPLIAGLALYGCGGGGDTADTQGGSGGEAGAITGGNTVTDVIHAGKYTYVEVKHNNETLWAAAPQFEVAVGDEVVLPQDMMPMQNWHSKTLDRTWDVVYFASSITKAGGGHGSTGGMEGMTPDNDLEEALDFSGLETPAGGHTVAEIFEQHGSLDGTDIKVRGMVVKVTKNVMGKNWIHLRDGTGDPGANDLTVTTQASPEVGDTILVSGSLHTDVDFGAGYYFDVIIEDADVTIE